MKAFKINGLWCLSTDQGTLLCFLNPGEKQPLDRSEALQKLLLKLNRKDK